MANEPVRDGIVIELKSKPQQVNTSFPELYWLMGNWKMKMNLKVILMLFTVMIN